MSLLVVWVSPVVPLNIHLTCIRYFAETLLGLGALLNEVGILVCPWVSYNPRLVSLTLKHMYCSLKDACCFFLARRSIRFPSSFDVGI